MKIAITGHTSGIGLAISELYSSHGHDIIGFSRKTGYDIANPVDRNRIIKESTDCDMFINNAYSIHYSVFAQCELLLELWESWKEQKKTIVNISSGITTQYRVDYPSTKYKPAKTALNETCEFLWNKSPWPFVMLASPTLTDTNMNKHNPNPNKMSADKFAEILYYNLNQTECRVQMLSLALAPK
jgi:short-subunit dehydrogenase involved in D-alanine esterification of teichoic acids